MFVQCSTWNAVIAGEAVGAGEAAGAGPEIRQVAEGGEPFELGLAGEAFGPAAVAEDRKGSGWP